MFGAFVRSSLTRTIVASKIFTFGCGSLNEIARNAMVCLRTTTITSPPLYPSSLMVGSIREKACLNKNKSAAKRFIIRGGGRIKRGKGGRSHNTGHKGRKRINQLASSTDVLGTKAIENRMRILIRA